MSKDDQGHDERQKRYAKADNLQDSRLLCYLYFQLK